MLKCIRITLAVFLAAAATLAQANEGLRSDYYSVDEIAERYSEKQFESIAVLVCDNLDYYKDDPRTVMKKDFPGCNGAYSFVCAKERETLSIGGIVRASISETLKIRDEAEFEKSVPGVISNALGVNCTDTSYHYALNIPFLKQRRNFAKRAIFIGKAQSFFDNFIFEEYSTVENGKRKTVIDINAVEYVDGEPETLLDYLDKIVERGHASRLGGSNWDDLSGGSGYAPGTSLRSVLPALGAVNAIDLDCEPGQRTGCKVKRRIDREACEKHCLIDMGTKTERAEGRKVTYRNKVVDTVCFSQCAVRGEFVPPDIDWTKRYGGFLRPENIEWQSQ